MRAEFYTLSSQEVGYRTFINYPCRSGVKQKNIYALGCGYDGWKFVLKSTIEIIEHTIVGVADLKK